MTDAVGYALRVKLPSFAIMLPLLVFVVPTAAIGYGIVLPRAGHAATSEIGIGFAGSIVAACITYAAGIRAARKEQR